MNSGETGLTYNICVETHKGRKKTVTLKSVAVNNAATPLVVFSHSTPLEWISTVKTIRKTPGEDNIGLDVDQTATGTTTLQALELALQISYSPTGTSTEVVRLNLPLTVC
jgi:hypothetical protein